MSLSRTDDKAGQVQSKLSAGVTKRDIENILECTRLEIQSRSAARRAAWDLVVQNDFNSDSESEIDKANYERESLFIVHRNGSP